MTTANTYNPLINTGFGNPVIPVADVINLCQVYETFDLLPSVDNVVSLTTSTQFTLIPATLGGNDVTYSPEGAGIEVLLSDQDPAAVLWPVDTQVLANKTNSTAWSTDASLIFDASVKLSSDPGLGILCGFSDNPSILVQEGLALRADQTLSPNFLVASVTGGVVTTEDTGVPLIFDERVRLTILVGRPDFPSGRKRARFFVNGSEIGALEAPPVTATPMFPSVAGYHTGAPADQTFTVYAIRAGRKF